MLQNDSQWQMELFAEFSIFAIQYRPFVLYVYFAIWKYLNELKQLEIMTPWNGPSPSFRYVEKFCLCKLWSKHPTNARSILACLTWDIEPPHLVAYCRTDVTQDPNTFSFHINELNSEYSKWRTDRPTKLL